MIRKRKKFKLVRKRTRVPLRRKEKQSYGIARPLKRKRNTRVEPHNFKRKAKSLNYYVTFPDKAVKKYYVSVYYWCAVPMYMSWEDAITLRRDLTKRFYVRFIIGTKDNL